MDFMFWVYLLGFLYLVAGLTIWRAVTPRKKDQKLCKCGQTVVGDKIE